MLEVFDASPEQLRDLVARIRTVLGGRHPETPEMLEAYLDGAAMVLEPRETRVMFLRAIQALEVVEPQVFTALRLWAKEVRHG